MKVNYLLIGIIVGSLLLFVFVYPQGVNRIFKYLNIEISTPNVPFRLGLDLLGGTHLVYQADLSKSENKNDAMQGREMLLNEGLITLVLLSLWFRLVGAID